MFEIIVLSIAVLPLSLFYVLAEIQAYKNNKLTKKPLTKTVKIIQKKTDQNNKIEKVRFNIPQKKRFIF